MIDVLIIGSGPAGMSAAIYAKRANLSVEILEKDAYATGQIADSNRVDNYIGMLGMNGFDLGEKFRADVESLGVPFIEGEMVGITKNKDFFEVSLEDSTVIEARTVIYAAGASHRHLQVPGEEEFLGKGISFCAVCDGAFFEGKSVAVVGGGDTALDDALYLSDLCEKVYLVHRRKEFRGSERTLQILKGKENVELVTDAQIAKITGEKTVSSIECKDGRTLVVAGIFVAIGMEPRTAVLKDFVELSKEGYVVASEDCVTNVAGFYAAGDVRTKKLRQVSTAVADGANAATEAGHYLAGIGK